MITLPERLDRRLAPDPAGAAAGTPGDPFLDHMLQVISWTVRRLWRAASLKLMEMTGRAGSWGVRTSAGGPEAVTLPSRST
ncbi:hypothetical protein [Streptomyces sp. NPDC004629]|uniref:hypothetical protein n=1 Tax=Streptomyces sp. NPDC004629 TaxID=3364705 RepID=UPI003695AFF0